MQLDELLDVLRDPGESRRRADEVVRALAVCPATLGEEAVRELTIRALERSSELGKYSALIDDLARRVGLYPYVQHAEGSAADCIALEINRVDLPSESLFMHREQSRLLRKLVRGENLILSAPTSFGKSLLVDAAIASIQPQNALIVVPTIALIDETRRRLTKRFRDEYKVITHLSQERAPRNLFVLTQERVAGCENDIPADLLVIDEFYKLSPDRGDRRFSLLNQVFYRYAKRGVQFYLLGPHISALPARLPSEISLAFEKSSFQTVVTEVSIVDPGEDELQSLVELVSKLDGPTVVYVGSPRSAGRVATAIATQMSTVPDGLAGAVEWISQQYHPDWTLAKCLASGVGLHHGRVPRALAQYIVRQFNSRVLPVLVCTSTLIEGVNTAARNVVVYDNRIGGRLLDFFTFANIRGRSGRMFEHFVGHVYAFHSPPDDAMTSIDIPAFTQSDGAPAELLAQLDEEDLTDSSKGLVQSCLDSRLLPLPVLRSVPGVPADTLLDVARKIDSRPEYFSEQLGWRWRPMGGQLYALAQLLWDCFDRPNGRAVVSAKQLGWKLGEMTDFRGVAELARLDIENENKKYRREPDDAISKALDFLSTWCQFWVPRGIRAVDTIQKHVLQLHNLPSGELTAYADEVESLFLPASALAVDEYGLPFQLALKLDTRVDLNSDLDSVLDGLRGLLTPVSGLSDFENQMLDDFRRGL